MIQAITTPATTERNMTIAREASNLQKKKVITTGTAFWIEKMTTIVMMTATTSSKNISLSVIVRTIQDTDESIQVYRPHRGCQESGLYGAEGGTRTRMDFSTRPSNVRVYQFHHFGIE
jgi:hypothetical protein